MKFPPAWSMESILIVALAVAVIVVVFAQSSVGHPDRFTVEPTEKTEQPLRLLPLKLRPSIGDDSAVPGR